LESEMSKPQKPTGTSGPIRLTTGLNGGQAEFVQLSWPKTKGDIEDFIVRGFLNTANKQGILHASIESLKRNALDDFDFTVTTASGPGYIELMEIAPLEHFGTTYSQAPASYKPYDFAHYILDKILGKSIRYSSDTQMMLLLYVTDWHFKLDLNTLKLLKYWTAHSRHCFKSIYYYHPVSEENGIAHIVFPTPDNWLGFNPDKYSRVVASPLDPNDWQIKRI